MTATAADYVWFNERFPELARAYCITLVYELPQPSCCAGLPTGASLHSPGYRHSSTPPTNSVTDNRTAAH
ncbi:hypothetical protein SAMN04487982_11090 [Streptomyces sp. ok210]|nr:DUF6461 domain-containing protein [Streptomyces sp. ok210]SFT21561.1 hypothetical protein SAMN04487982_11090 [Streptomyces sp. ok210]